MASETPIRIALLQGNPTVARRMEQILKDSHQFEVERLQGLPPGARRAQAVLIDVDSGVDSARRWINHCDGRQLPVILCGVHRTEEAAGGRHWLNRPFSPQQLVEICQDAVGLAKLEVRGKQDVPTLDLGGQREEEEAFFDVLDLDGSASMILEIEDLAEREHVGGMLVSDVECRHLDEQALNTTNPWASMPDTEVEASSDEPAMKGQAVDQRTTEVTAVSTIESLSGRDLSSTHQVAGLLAEYWQRLGLAARPADRADRLQRVLAALMKNGLQGVLGVLERVPPAEGFGGSLGVLSVLDLLNLVRDRNLRGRLEVALRSESYVLYLEGTTLHSVESLGENTERLLVDSLVELGIVGQEQKSRYMKMLDTSSAKPLEMVLRQEGEISPGALLEAKRHKARQLLAKICEKEAGNFAFIEVDAESRQVWPTQSLALNIEALLLEVMRGGERAGAEQGSEQKRYKWGRNRLSTDMGRALTQTEQDVLQFFEREESLASAKEAITSEGESVEEVARRLERLKLLRQLGQEEGGEHEQAPLRVDEDRLERVTAVGSNWEIDPWEGKPNEDPSGTDKEALKEETREEISYRVGMPDEDD